MTQLKWWLRIVGAVYVLNAVMMAVVRAPIASAGPEGALARAAEGDSDRAISRGHLGRLRA